MTMQHDIDEDVARLMAQADAMIQAAQYELDRTATFFKKNKLDLSMDGSNLSAADQAEVLRRVTEGRRQIDAEVDAARLTLGTHTLGSQTQARKSRLMRNMV